MKQLLNKNILSKICLSAYDCDIYRSLRQILKNKSFLKNSASFTDAFIFTTVSKEN